MPPTWWQNSSKLPRIGVLVCGHPAPNHARTIVSAACSSWQRCARAWFSNSGYLKSVRRSGRSVSGMMRTGTTRRCRSPRRMMLLPVSTNVETIGNRATRFEPSSRSVQ